QLLARRRMEALPNRLKLLLRDLARETEFRGAAALPVADYSLLLGVVVAVHQMVRRVPFPVRHRANRQHARLPCARSARWNIPSCSLERDTIPKPFGFGRRAPRAVPARFHGCSNSCSIS